MPSITRSEISEIFNDAGYGLGVIGGATWFASVHPELSAYFLLASVLSLGLANRVNPPTPAPPTVQ